MTKCDPEAQEILEYIAESPAAEYGGFDDRTIRAARWAVEKLAAARAEIERLQAERDECRRLLMQIADEWDRLNRNKPGNRPITPIVLLREWREAARAAGGEE